MSSEMIEFRANGHSASGYLAKPSHGTGPGVVVIQEYWGLVDHIKDVADRFAAEGFVALAPDLFHGDSTKNSGEAGRRMMALDIANAGKEIRGAAEYLLASPLVEPKKVAAVGFCMGGQLALLSAADHGDVVAAAVDFYGIHPHAKVEFDKLRVPVLGHFALHDEYVKESDARALVERIREAGGDVEVHFYDAQHAFFNDARPEVYSEPDANVAWQRTLTFLRKELR